MHKLKISTKFILLMLFMFFFSTSCITANAAAKPVKPQIKLNVGPLKEYKPGDKATLKVSAPNYSGKVQYRVIVFNQTKKTNFELFKAYKGYYNSAAISGKTLSTLTIPLAEAGTYSVSIYVKRNGANVSYDTYIKTINFTVKRPKVVLNKENTIYKPVSAKTPLVYGDDVTIAANSITIEDANIQGNLYISANNAFVKNSNIKGTVFINPGKDGDVTLEGVSADNVKVLSGGENSIHLNNLKAKKLTVESASKVRIESSGATKIDSTEVKSNAILDLKSGTMGKITVLSGKSEKLDIELRGTYNEPIIIQSEASIKLSSSTTVSEMQAKANINIKLADDAKITDLKKDEGIEAKTEGKAAEPQPQTPPAASEVPAQPQTPQQPQVPPVVVIPGGGGGGGGPQIPADTTPPKIEEISIRCGATVLSNNPSFNAGSSLGVITFIIDPSFTGNVEMGTVRLSEDIETAEVIVPQVIKDMFGVQNIGPFKNITSANFMDIIYSFDKDRNGINSNKIFGLSAVKIRLTDKAGNSSTYSFDIR